MKTTFTTETGSRYCVDHGALTIERLAGKGSPTARVVKDCTPRRFESISAIEVGASVVVWWGEHAAVPAVEGAESATVTSHVVAVDAMEPA